MYDTAFDLIKTQQISFINTFVPNQVAKEILVESVEINNRFLKANAKLAVTVGETVSKLITK